MKGHPTMILMITDSTEEVGRIGEMLSQMGDDLLALEQVRNIGDAVFRSDRRKYGLILLDLSLPESQGMETFIKLHDQISHIPIVVLAGGEDEEVAVQTLREGAQEYLLKSEMNSKLLGRAIIYAIERNRLRVELKRKADSLKGNQERFRRIIETLKEGILILDRKSILKFANRAAESLFELHLGKDMEEFFGLSLAPGDTEEVKLRGRGDRPVIAVVSTMEIHWYGEPSCLVSIHDITERRHARALQLQVEAQAEMVRHLRELDIMKADFVETVTHEMRTPMTPLKSAVELFLDGSLGPVTPKQQELLELMERNIQRLARFATDVLTLSRLDAGRHLIKPKQVNLKSTLMPAIELMKSKAQAKDSRIVIDMDEALSVFADTDAMSEVVINLLDNAITHNPEGREIIISARPNDRGSVEIRVKDDGKGMKEEDRRRIFDRFFQADRQAGPGYRGTGIGLSVCQSMIRKMGGEIEVASSPGKGTTFTFTLPADSRMDDSIFGRIALDRGYVTLEQIEEVMDFQNSSDEINNKIGELLVQRGYLNPLRRDEILKSQSKQASENTGALDLLKMGNELFARIALKKGYLSEVQLNTCKSELGRLLDSGENARLCDLCFKKGYLTRTQFVQLLGMQRLLINSYTV